jgi:CubicO group peptidase (beta-lactamase class C family)
MVDSLAASQGFSGVVLIAHNGSRVVEKAYGLADREAARPNDVETAFNLGSINKFFTEIAIRQLAAQGKLDLDSTLGRYWPDYPNPAVLHVTIRQLLEHRSGIGGNIFAAPAAGKRSDIRKLADFLPLFVNEPLVFEPGTQQRYSNAGFVVLGLLLERLSGESYYDYVRRHIYDIAGMTRTAHWAVDSLPANTAIGYTATGRNSDLLPGRGSSAGGGYSTAHDLLRLLNALRDNKIPGGQGLGFGIAGGAPGINAVVESALPGGYDVIVLANLDPPAAERMGKALRERLH